MARRPHLPWKAPRNASSRLPYSTRLRAFHGFSSTRCTRSTPRAFMLRRRFLPCVTLPAWQGMHCHALRDCNCCGARGALLCMEPREHDGIHAFHCRNCGRGSGCWN